MTAGHNIKICNKCKQVFDVSLFSKDSSKRDGLRTICKMCSKIATNDRHRRYKTNREIPNNKTCGRCSVNKASESFCFDDWSKDGLFRYCRECLHQINTSDACRLSKLAYKKSLKGLEAERRYSRKHRGSAKRKARQAVSNAIKSKRLVAVTMNHCAHCADVAVHYHHHNGYERKHWLDVIPLCLRCHQLTHNC